ncbi:MAG: hypothetical protein HY917_05435 [Candidatus Diapherotrites archaeon]|nr:hypothetical protein [Candidatus Diapherotrites archaeon]
MNEKGFTLFTALVAVVLIVLSALLVNSMVASENSILSVLEERQEQERMQAITDMARADVLQTFNYSIRQEMEEYFSKQRSGLTPNYISLDMKEDNWQKLKNGVQDQFVSTNGVKFARRMSLHLPTLATNTLDPRGYIVSVKHTEHTDEFVDTIQKVFVNSRENKQFLFINNCGNDDSAVPDWKDCEGSFYLLLDFASIPDADYEKLPFIEVKSTRTNRSLSQPLIPRGKIRLYVPLRIFKAMAAAHAFGKMLTGNGFMEDIGRLRLGFCDASFPCSPREDPLREPAGEWNAACDASIGLNTPYSGTSYSSVSQGSVNNAVIDVARTLINERIQQVSGNSGFSDGLFGMESDPAPSVLTILDTEKTRTFTQQGTDVGLYCAAPEQVRVFASFKDDDPLFIISKKETTRYFFQLGYEMTPPAFGGGGSCTTEQNPAGSSDKCVPG